MKKNCQRCFTKQTDPVSDEEIALISRYVPFRLVKEAGTKDCCLFEKRIEPLFGVIAYLDIVGFTTIVSEYIENKKDVGELSDSFSSYYSVIIETLREFGGSVFQFAGDSLLIVFEAFADETPEENWQRSFAAMYRTYELSTNYNDILEIANGFALRPKIGMSSGPFYQLLLGSEQNFITPVVTGLAVREAVGCEKKCCGQDFFISKAAYEQAQKSGMENWFTPKEDGFSLKTVPEDFVQSAPHPPYIDSSDLSTNPYFYKRLQTFINPQILQQIKTQFTGFSGDYREITCIMLRLDGNFTQTAEDIKIEKGFKNFTTVYELVQSKTVKYGGFCNRPDLSDKGLVFPILFGVPIFLENKEESAILFANDVLQTLKSLPIVSAAKAGIATGTVYAGEFGAAIRKDYTLVGNIINIAARLMMYNTESELFSLYSEEKTAKKTEDLCLYKAVPDVALKGFAEKRTIYQFVHLEDRIKIDTKEMQLFGRDSELKQFKSAFSLCQQGHVCTLPVIGDAGMGKTFLIESFISDVQKKYPAVRIIEADNFQYEESTPFFCWRTIIYKLAGIFSTHQKEEEQVLLKKLFESHFSSSMEWYHSFLNIFGGDFPEDASLASMDTAAKQNMLFSFIHQLILSIAETLPLILIIEDIQWCDAVSLKLLEYIMCRLDAGKVLIIPISRNTIHIQKFFRVSSINYIYLDALESDAAVALTSFLMNLQTPEDELVAKIVATSEGNPLFIVNIVNSLIDSNILCKTEDGKRYVAKNIHDIKIPPSVQNIILARLNALNVEEQAICKTAAAIGQRFSAPFLHQLLPDTISEESLANSLATFEAQHLTQRHSRGENTYAFQNKTIRDVIYATILENTRKDLNTQILVQLENGTDETQMLEEKLHYASEAKLFDKIYVYAIHAAKQAEKQSAVQDAIQYYLTALQSISKCENQVPQSTIHELYLKLATDYRKNGEYENAKERYISVIKNEKDPILKTGALQGLGRCCQEQGRFDEAVKLLEQALHLLSKRAPQSIFAVYAALTKEIIRNIMLIATPSQYIRQYSGKKKQNAEICTDILCVLNKLYYFDVVEKIAWGAITNYNNILHNIEQKALYSTVIGDFAVSLVSMGFTSYGKKLFDTGNNLAASSGNATEMSIFRARYAFYFMFYDKIHHSISLLENATEHFRTIGETWELMTAEGALAQNYFLAGDFNKSIEAYMETERVARKLHSTMHIGWAFNKIPFMKYLRGEYSTEKAVSVLKEGIALSESVHDHMTLCIHYGYLAYIAEKSQQPEDALLYAEKILAENALYKVKIPHIKISYTNAADAICFALESGAVPANKQRKYRKMVSFALKKARSFAPSYKLIRGAYLRSSARFALLQGKTEDASILCADALREYEASAYTWEYANTLFFAHYAGFDSADTLLTKARTILTQHSLAEDRHLIPPKVL